MTVHTFYKQDKSAAPRQQCLRSSSFDSDVSTGVLVRRNEDNAWRKFGTRWRLEKLRADEEARGDSFMINHHCSIERYYEIADRVQEQFMESLQYNDRLEESYISGSRLLKFLTSSLPTHRRFYSKDPLLTKLRIKSRNDLAQLGILVEEVALKIDKNIYEDYLWGKVPDCAVEPSLHPLIFDDDNCSKKSSKKVTFSLQKSDFSEDASLPPDANVSSSSSTSATEISDCSLSSPELLHNQENAHVSFSNQPWFSNVTESSKLQRNNVFRGNDSMNNKEEIFPTNGDNFILDRVEMSSQIIWSRNSKANEDEVEKKSAVKNSSIGEPHCNPAKIHRPTQPPPRKPSTSWDSGEDEDLDHADYVKQLTQLEFNYHESPIRRPRLNVTFGRKDEEIHPRFTATQHDEDEMKGCVCVEQYVRKPGFPIHKVEGDSSAVEQYVRKPGFPSHEIEDDSSAVELYVRKPGFPSHEIEDDSSASPTSIVDFNDCTRRWATSLSSYQNPKVTVKSTEVYTDQFSESSSSEVEDEDIDLYFSTSIGIARRDELYTDDTDTYIEHVQYLKHRLIEMDDNPDKLIEMDNNPEVNESSWGKRWLKQVKDSSNNASLDLEDRHERVLNQSPDTDESNVSQLTIGLNSKSHHGVIIKGVDSNGRPHRLNGWNRRLSLDAPDDEFDENPDCHRSPDYRK